MSENNKLVEIVKGQGPLVVALAIILAYLYYEGNQARVERDDIRDQVAKIIATCKQ